MISFGLREYYPTQVAIVNGVLNAKERLLTVTMKISTLLANEKERHTVRMRWS